MREKINKSSLFFCLLVVFFLFVCKVSAQTTSNSNRVITRVGNAPLDQKPGGNFVYYCQGNTHWASSKYECEDIGGAGCGPTSIAMIMSTLGYEITPPETAAAFMSIDGAAICNKGSYIPVVLNSSWFKDKGFIAAEDIRDKSSHLDPTLARAYLSQGAYILASSDDFPCANCKPGTTTVPHIFVVDKIIDDNTVSIRDPNNCSYSDGDDENPNKMVHRIDQFVWSYAIPITRK